MRGDHAARGATLVEYALVFSLVVVAALGAIEFLDAQSRNEINNQADCVSMRPPPASCQLTAITTTTTVVPPPTTSTTAPLPAEAEPIVRAVPPARASVDPAPRWIELDVSVSETQPVDLGGGEAPVAGAVVRAEVLLVDPVAMPEAYLPDEFFVNCTTGATGQCTLRFDVPFTDVTKLRMDVTSVDAPVPPVFPSPITVEMTWP